jgi:hypothetical protein
MEMNRFEQYESNQRQVLHRAIAGLPSAISSLEERVGRPAYVEDGDDSRFGYEKPSWQIYQLLKLVRVVSALRAALLLLEEALVIEVAVLLRTIDDFLDEAMFGFEAAKASVRTTEQQMAFDHFFRDFKDKPRELLEGRPKLHRLERRKIQASQGRQLDPDNPHDVKMMAGAVDGGLSGYVHGDYSTIMEMYVGGRNEFDMRGMPTSPTVVGYRQALGNYVQTTLLALARLATSVDAHALASGLL